MASKKTIEKLKKRRKELKSKKSGLPFFVIKADTTTRMRAAFVGDIEPGMEIQQFYLGGDIKGVISPVSVGQPCAIMEKYNELKESKDPSDQELAKKLIPRTRWMVLHYRYNDDKGKEVDEQAGVKPLMMTSGLYQDFIDHFLDDEWGDMTDQGPDGYDIKYTRKGSGKMDTEYSLIPCKPSRGSKPFANQEFDLTEEVSKCVPSYDETVQLLDEFLGTAGDGEEEEDDMAVSKPKKKRSKTSTKKRTTKKKRSK